jgi:hypothetical protein
LDDWLSKRGQPKPAATAASGAPAAPAPAAAQSAPAPQAQDTSSTKNISSEAVEKQEVDKIAEELKQYLKKSKQPSEKKAEPAEQIIAPTPASGKKTDGEIPLNPPKHKTAAEDTIYIDQDGNLHQVNEASS